MALVIPVSPPILSLFAGGLNNVLGRPHHRRDRIVARVNDLAAQPPGLPGASFFWAVPGVCRFLGIDRDRSLI